MVDKTFLHWPFFGDEHRDVQLRLKEFISREFCAVDHGNIDQACKKLVSALGEANFLIIWSRKIKSLFFIKKFYSNNSTK